MKAYTVKVSIERIGIMQKSTTVVMAENEEEAKSKAIEYISKAFRCEPMQVRIRSVK